MNKSRIALIAVVVGVVAVVLLVQATLVLRVDRHAIVTEFGKPVRILSEPGLYLITPFVQQVNRLDKRILEWDDEPQEVIMKDKKRLLINTFARWRIGDPLRFYLAVREERAAQLTLDKIVGGAVRDVVSRHTLDEVVRNSTRDLTYVGEDSQKSPTMTRIQKGEGRTAIFGEIFTRSADELSETYGIALIDVQIKQLNYTDSAQQATIRNMISEREKVAAMYEAQGGRQVLRIQGETQEQVRELDGEAVKSRLQLYGEGRSEAARIKAAAYGRDPKLFEFLRTLELYEQSVDRGTTLVLSTDAPLFRLLLDEESMDKHFAADPAAAPSEPTPARPAPRPAPRHQVAPVPEPPAPEPPVTP